MGRTETGGEPMRLILAVLGAVTLAACMPVATVEPVAPPPPAVPAAEAFPGVDVEATAACVRENATEGELALMALGDERAQTATAQVLQRPGTLGCLQRSGVSLPGLPGT
jgi:hypothetical protein